MKNLLSTTAAVALALAVASCGSTEEPAQAPETNATDGMAVVDANNPFSAAEMQMNEKMMAATGTDVGDNWAKKMIEHHQGAIVMSQVMLEQNPTPDVEKMARMGIAKQQADLEAIRKLLKTGAPDNETAKLYQPAMVEMHEKMMAAKGADVSETFMRKMLEHHRGAVAMSDVALRNGVSGALRQQVQKTRDENQKDAAMVEAMLGGQSHDEAMAASGAKPPAAATADRAPAEKAEAAPRTRPGPAAPKATRSPNPAPTPAPPASEAACLPEHKEAGHC